MSRISTISEAVATRYRDPCPTILPLRSPSRAVSFVSILERSIERLAFSIASRREVGPPPPGFLRGRGDEIDRFRIAGISSKLFKDCLQKVQREREREKGLFFFYRRSCRRKMDQRIYRNIGVCARATRTNHICGWSVATILLARWAAGCGVVLSTHGIRESRKDSVVAGPPPRRVQTAFAKRLTRERFCGAPVFSLHPRLSLPLPLFFSFSVFSPILSAPFSSFAPTFPLPRAKYLAVAVAKIRREPKRSCHILVYERSWIQLNEVSETRRVGRRCDGQTNLSYRL